MDNTQVSNSEEDEICLRFVDGSFCADFALLASEEINKSSPKNENLIEVKTWDHGLEIKCFNMSSESFSVETMNHDILQFI